MAGDPALLQNINLAIPSREVTALLVTAHQEARPLESAANENGTFSEGTIWTSMTSGRDYSLKRDGDYLYIDWVNINPSVKTEGGFIRSELGKTRDGKWRGKTHQRLPCTYDAGRWMQHYYVTNWCSYDSDIEIDLLSDKRIEGVSAVSEKFDCYKCEAGGRVKDTRFVWILK